MCGIAGLLGRPARESEIAAGLAAIAHRGPDGSGVHRDGDVCLLHTRLSIIDLSDRARQPMTDPGTGVVVIFNGEIYNYRELRREFDPAAFFSESDTEVLLRIYLRDGIAGVRRLRGMFAFAIWDPRTRTAHLARDRLGIKPLHYAVGDGGLAFGSEIKAVLAFSGRARLNLSVLRDYLEEGHLARGADTFFAGVRTIDPGTVVTVAGADVAVERYWTPSEAPAREPSNDVEEEAWNLLVETARLHMISDVPVGICLSAGFDSQFIARLLAHIGVEEIEAFTWSFDDPDYDEARRIATTSFPMKFRHHPVVLRPEDVIPTLLEATRFYEVPLGGVGTVGHFRIMQRARGTDVRVVLAGYGSDEIFAGYHYYYFCRFRDLLERGETDRLAAELAAFERIYGVRLVPGSPEFERSVKAASENRAAPDGTAISGNAFLGSALRDAPPTPPAAATGREETGHLRRRMLGDLTTEKLNKQVWYDDRGSMAWGIESRVPFLDHRLVEWTRALPDEWLIRDGVNKFLPKRLLKRFCGVDRGDTPKQYVSNPQREWLKGPLFAPACDLLRDGALAQSGLVDMPAFLGAYENYARAAELGNSFFVWKMIAAETLMRSFFATA